MSSLGPKAQELVRAGREALRPAEGDRERILAAVRARVGGPGGAPPGDALAPAASSSGAGWFIASAIVAAGLGLGAVLWLARGSGVTAVTPGPSVSALRAPVELPPVSLPRDTSAAPLSSARSAAAVASTTSARSPAARSLPARDHQDSLTKEVAVLSKATAELRAGRFASAIRLLDEHERSFPSGALSQERIGARVQALCGQGRVAEAKAQLKRLSPGSLQEVRAREACGLGSANDGGRLAPPRQ